VAAGIVEQLMTSGSGVQRDGAGDAVVGVHFMDGELVQVAVALGEIALSLDGLTFALLLGADAQIDGYRHTGIPACVAASILRTTMTTKKTRPLSQVGPNQVQPLRLRPASEGPVLERGGDAGCAGGGGRAGGAGDDEREHVGGGQVSPAVGIAIQ
jgi:hypothetical protein